VVNLELRIVPNNGAVQAEKVIAPVAGVVIREHRQIQ
jgi:hypothetical protein